MAVLFLDTLLCHTTEDTTGPDEPYIKVDGITVWDQINQGLNDGQYALIQKRVSMQHSERVVVSLYDADSPDSDDLLGNIIVFAEELNKGIRSQKFTGDGADYTLYYEVIDR